MADPNVNKRAGVLGPSPDERRRIASFLDHAHDVGKEVAALSERARLELTAAAPDTAKIQADLEGIRSAIDRLRDFRFE